jgi:hypothetical protein
MSATIQERQAKTTEEVSVERDLAATFASPSASDRWLKTPNPILNGDRPIECLRRHEFARVRAALEAFNTGVYI